MTPKGRPRWGEALNAWHIRWREFIAERTYARDDPGNPKAARQEWWWTHRELRRCYRWLEGGVNSPLKRMLLDHRGLPEEHMRHAGE